MPKEEWGTKRLCPQCNTRFYDLKKDPLTCPACGSGFTIESLLSGRSRALIAEKAAAHDEQDDVVDHDDLDDDTDGGDLDDDLLDDDTDDGDVSLDEIADVAGDDDE